MCVVSYFCYTFYEFYIVYTKSGRFPSIEFVFFCYGNGLHLSSNQGLQKYAFNSPAFQVHTNSNLSICGQLSQPNLSMCSAYQIVNANGVWLEPSVAFCLKLCAMCKGEVAAISNCILCPSSFLWLWVPASADACQIPFIFIICLSPLHCRITAPC